MWILGVHQAHIITVNFWQKQLSKKKKKDLKSQVFDDSEIKAHGLLVERGNLN